MPKRFCYSHEVLLQQPYHGLSWKTLLSYLHSVGLDIWGNVTRSLKGEIVCYDLTKEHPEFFLLLLLLSFSTSNSREIYFIYKKT